MSFQFLKFASNSRSPSRDTSPKHPKTPHVKLKEDYYESNPFPSKESVKFNDIASVDTMNFFKSIGSPQSLNTLKTPKSPSNLKNTLPPLQINNPNRKSLPAEPQFIKLHASPEKSYEERNERGVSRVLQDYSPSHISHPAPYEEQQPKKDVSAEIYSKDQPNFQYEQEKHDDFNNSNAKDKFSKRGSFADSQRMFIIEERSNRKKLQENRPSKREVDESDEDAITEEDNNISLGSDGQGVTAQRIDIFSKYNQTASKEPNAGGFSNLRNLYADSEPEGSQTHRGRREEVLVGRSNTDPEVEEIVNGQNPIQQEQAIEVRTTEPQSNQMTIDVQKLADIDASLYLRKACALCIAIILCTLLLVPMINHYDGYRMLFIVIYVFLVYLALENGIRLRSPETQEWKKNDRIFDFLEIIAAIFFQVCIDLRLAHVISNITVAFIPPLALTVLYYAVSSAPRSTKDIRALARLLYTCQALLIVLKLSGSLQWEWSAVVLVLWVYFSFATLYSVIIAILLVSVIFVAIFRLQSYTVSNLIIRGIGLLWYSSYHSLSIIALACLVGMTQAYDSQEGLALLETSLAYAQYASCGILAYTIVLFFQLKKFIKTFEQNRNVVASNDRLVENVQPKHVLDFQVKDGPSYFVMLSSTYFLPLHEGFLTKSKEKLQRRKHTKPLKLNTTKAGTLIRSDSTNTPNKSLLIEELKRDKKALDQKLEGTSTDLLKNPSVKSQKQKKKGSVPENLTQVFNKGENYTFQLDDGSGPVTADEKLFVSMDNVYDISPIWRNRMAGQEEEGLCYICFASAPDAVLMDCGHGGICCGCAISMIKDKNECMECRKPVKAVYKVDRSLKMSGIVKGSELTKVVEIGVDL